mmetsp:Transcript_2025/g.2878  ORF Transcript_2025/g.2878 Transcript_2025/m.2878 type:complete len:171 (+) Transcript_2025:185-697(+)
MKYTASWCKAKRFHLLLQTSFNVNIHFIIIIIIIIFGFHHSNRKESKPALAGTVQLSSPKGNNSTNAQIALISAIRPIKALISNVGTIDIAPTTLPSHSDNPTEHNVEARKNAIVPAIDFLGLKNHLLFFPNLLPIKSASPSPAAMVDNATTPTKLSLQNNIVAMDNIIT